MRILTTNLLHVHSDAAAFGTLLDDHRPDVVAVQELSSAAAREIETRYAYSDLEPTDDPQGMGIASAAPAIFDRIDLAHTDAWRATLDGIEVVSVHVRNPVDLPLIEVNRQRRSQIRALLDHAASGDGSLAVVGDFNASPAWPAYRQFRAVLDDAVRTGAGDRAARSMRTWGPRSLGGRRFLRIDHVFVRGLRGIDARILEVPGSDHAAVLVDLA